MNIIDLFSGAGGLTFGFYYNLINDSFEKKQNNTFLFANEFDKQAATAFSSNYKDIKMINEDIAKISRKEILSIIGDNDVDLVIGGPPCQSFSTVGKRCFDDKAKLYKEYLRILKITKPKIFLFENVKGMLSMHEQIEQRDQNNKLLKDENGKIITKPGRLIIDIIEDELSALTRKLGYTIVGKEVLNAVNYGVPQNRERVIIVGVRNDLLNKMKWKYPEPTHGKDKTDHITIKEAIDDFPSLKEGQNKTRYTKQPTNDYQKLMRKDSKEITHHYCGVHNDKMRTVIANVPQGEGRPYINKLVEKGILDSKYKLTSGYNNTYGRLVENKPSTTITNNMCCPSALRCIHYKQNRELSPREGARIQSFPDWFIFSGHKSDVTKQIGNAVPPLLSIAIANQIELMFNQYLKGE